MIPDALRRAFTQVRNGRPRPVVVEIPTDVFQEDVPEPFHYKPVVVTRSAPDPLAVGEVAQVLVEAKRPVLYAGQGVHYAQAWPELRELAELLAAPVTTSLEGKSAFPETHPLSLGSGGRSVPKTVHDFLQNSDVIFGIGCSFAVTNYGVSMPPGKVIIHATLDPADLNKDVPAEYALIGDAKLTLQALIGEVKDRLGASTRDMHQVAAQIKQIKDEWLAQWLPKLTANDVPLSPYRVIWDLMHTVDIANTIITHDAGSPPGSTLPLLAAGRAAHLHRLGQDHAARLRPRLGHGGQTGGAEKLCINLWGDAAIGFTGMDFETAVRERIPILSVLLNNFSMAIELPIMKVATEKYRSTDISGNYADMAKAFGGYGERVTQPAEIVPALKRAIKMTQEGTPALLEFLTAKEIQYSIFR